MANKRVLPPEEFFEELEACGHKYYGEDLPEDFVWDVLPLLYVRIYSPAGWDRIKNAVRRFETNKDSEAENASTSPIQTIDEALDVLSGQDEHVYCLRQFHYAPVGVSEEYICSLFHVMNDVQVTVDGFYETYCRFMTPLDKDFATERPHPNAYRLFSSIMRSTKDTDFSGTIYCCNCCWPELIEESRVRLYSTRLRGWSHEAQNAYFAQLYGFLKGWDVLLDDDPVEINRDENNAVDTGDAAAQGAAAAQGDAAAQGAGNSNADSSSSNQAASKPASHRRFSCVIGEIPQCTGFTWIDAALDRLKPSGFLGLMLDYNPLESDEPGWKNLIAAGGLQALVTIPEGSIAIIRYLKREEDETNNTANNEQGTDTKKNDAPRFETVKLSYAKDVTNVMDTCYQASFSKDDYENFSDQKMEIFRAYRAFQKELRGE